MLVSNLNNNRSKKLHWQTEGVWAWHIVFTDHSADTRPRLDYLSPEFAFMQTNFGNSNKQCPQGPPSAEGSHGDN